MPYNAFTASDDTKFRITYNIQHYRSDDGAEKVLARDIKVILDADKAQGVVAVMSRYYHEDHKLYEITIPMDLNRNNGTEALTDTPIIIKERTYFEVVSRPQIAIEVDGEWKEVPGTHGQHNFDFEWKLQ